MLHCHCFGFFAAETCLAPEDFRKKVARTYVSFDIEPDGVKHGHEHRQGIIALFDKLANVERHMPDSDGDAAYSLAILTPALLHHAAWVAATAF